MELTGEYRLPASGGEVWKALHDPEVLRATIPGCKELEKISETEFTAKVTTKMGPMKVHFSGKVILSNLVPPVSYTITGEGEGGIAGFAKGSGGRCPRGRRCRNAVCVTLRTPAVGGKLAQLGSRLLKGTSQKLADAFFGAFAERMGGERQEVPG